MVHVGFCFVLFCHMNGDAEGLFQNINPRLWYLGTYSTEIITGTETDVLSQLALSV